MSSGDITLKIEYDEKAVREFLREIQEEVEKEFLEEATQYYGAIFTGVIEDLVEELEAIYEKNIDRFYNYKTKRYVRYGQSRPGTRSGIALYGGMRFNVEYSGGIVSGMTFSGSGDFMPSGAHSDNDDVLTSVMEGHRFPGFLDWVAFSFSSIFPGFRGTLIDIYDSISEVFAEVAQQIFFDRADPSYLTMILQ